jgi:hypothetical protein
MSRRFLAITFLNCTLGATCLTAACNPQTAALDLFYRQGLNLLRPARDYITPGGMVFVTKDGAVDYEEAKKGESAFEKGNLTDFRAAILDETENKSAGFGLALSLAKAVVPLGIAAGLSSEQEVSLGGIETTGTRLTSEAIDELIDKPKTKAAAIRDLLAGNRVFIVQEIYQATSLDLKASTSNSLSVTLNDGAAVAKCAADDKTKDDGSGQKSDKQPVAGDKKDDGSGQKPNKQPAPSDTKQPQPSTDKSGKPSEAPGTKSDKSQGGATPGYAGGVAFCMEGDYTLKLRATKPIPFAVRLAEVKNEGGKVVRVRSRTIKITLGPGTEDVAADTLPFVTVQQLPSLPRNKRTKP